jgi:fatty-acyl-CoA synthase
MLTRLSATRSMLAAAREAARSAASRVETAAALALKSGLLWELRPKGLVTAARLLARGRSGPSTIYRIHGANTPDKPALIFRDRSYTFGELDRSCDEIGAGLRHRGLTGQSVLVMMKNRPEYLILSTAGSRVGASVVTVSWRSTPAELAYLAAHCGAKMVVFEESLAPTIEKVRAELPGIAKENWVVAGAPESTAYTTFESLRREGHEAIEHHEEGAVVVYTSGTTGKPKGAVRKFNKELLPSVLRFLRATPFRHDDVHLAACPLYHTTAFGFIAFTYILGGTVVLLDEFEPRKFLEAIQRHRVTTTVLVPTMLHRLLALGDEEIQKYDTRTLRAIFCTSAPLPGPDSDKTMELFGDIVHNLYGATETGVVTLAYPDDLRRSPGTIGRAAAGNEIRLLDDQGRDVPEGSVGELFARNAMLVAGYHGDDAATRGSMRDGFFSVGDLARKDANGCYHLEGRKRDMIISGGVNVYPAEVEACLEGHADVDEVAVIGVPDPEWGERVQAVVVLRAEASNAIAADPAAALRAYCKERLAGPKVPREFVILPRGEHLPRNPTGKVLKRELRSRAITPATQPEGQAAR